MTLIQAETDAREIPFSDADFKAIAHLAQNEFGLNLAESKKPLVYSRLSKRLKARSITDFPGYLALLNKSEEKDERLELISALTTNVTSFFRENHHFETLRDDCIRQFIQKISRGERIRIWSAGCSSGQEAYSIAMTILDKIPNAGQKNVKILATDIDPQIVKKAKAGRYHADEGTGIPDSFQKKWMCTTPSQQIEMVPRPRVF